MTSTNEPGAVDVASVVTYLDELAPPALAAEWDNVGLLLGERSARVERLMTCLTATPESVAEAIEARAQLIVAHHPILFRPVRRLTSDTPEGRLLLRLVQSGVAVYSPHTAFDNATGGINDILCRRLGLTEVLPLRRRERRQFKVVVFVPESDLTRVLEALFHAGAGHIGQYRECSFRLAGIGTFFGSDASNPVVGQKGRREEVSEWRLEVVCPEGRLDEVIAAMRRAHSYEEPAFDVFPLKPDRSELGEGRLGRCAAPLALANLVEKVKTGLNARQVQIVGEPDRRIERLALACGAGGEFLDDAVRAGADVFLTGELRFHECLSAQARGLALILPGHYATERPGVEELAARLQQRWPNLTVWASRREEDPVMSQ